MILVGDIGGTNTRLALAHRLEGQWLLENISVVPTADDIYPLIQQYLEACGDPVIEVIACCGAGPIDSRGGIQLTNTGARLDPLLLAKAAKTSQSLLVNDFAAIAQAIPYLPANQLLQVGGRALDPKAPRVVIGAGTGLGVATLVPAGNAWVVIPGEGGHSDLAPVDESQEQVWARLRGSYGRVSAESVLSGPGLERLYTAAGAAKKLAAREIAEAAWHGEPMALQAVQMFTSALGGFAGNLALILGAKGGVYLAGGIVPGWGERFNREVFRQAFESKPPFQEWLEKIPSFVVTHPQPGLYGLAVMTGERF